jgi:DNA replication protein DnaC
MNPMPELTPLLKQLRLSGILDSLETRNREAIAHKLAYPEFLALLIQDEVARREQKKLATRLRRANFRSHKTLEQFDFDFNPKVNRALIQELASGRFIAEKVAVLIAGPCGTGKSHLAQALGHSAARQGYDVLFTTQSQLLGTLHAARATGSFERRFQAIVRVPLLIIDDFGLKPLRSPQDEDLHDLIGERYERAATIITSNLDFSEWGDAFPNRLLGAATLDRLRHGAYRIILDGDSYRAPRPLLNTAKSAVADRVKSAQS